VSEPAADSPLPAAPPPRGGLKSLAEVVNDASALLYHAVATGKLVAPEIRDPIIKAQAAQMAGQAASQKDESAFLEAYSRLAQIVAPVTAATLRATSREQANRTLLARLLRLRSASDAQIVAFRFGFLALCLLLVIAACEWSRTFITTIITGQEELVKVREELRNGRLSLSLLDEQIRALGAEPGRANAPPAAVRGSLMQQREELNGRLGRLREQQLGLEQRIAQGYATLNRFVPFVDWAELRNVILPIANMIGGFVLPLLYGALGTLAYILRAIYGQMVGRSFDPRQTGEFVVRIFLGMLSGITLQWIFVRDGGSVPGGITPVVLAFVGGYSVELLFTAMDRLLATATGSLKPTAAPAKAGAGAPPAELEPRSAGQ
jgi:hypothetical protein